MDSEETKSEMAETETPLTANFTFKNETDDVFRATFVDGLLVSIVEVEV